MIELDLVTCFECGVVLNYDYVKGDDKNLMPCPVCKEPLRVTPKENPNGE